MKILLTSDWYPPAVNGVVTSVLNLKRGLELCGHEVRVLTLSSTSRSYETDGVVYLGSVKADAVYPGARLRAAFGTDYLSQILQWGPAVVHSNCEFSTFPLARQVAEQLHVPLVHTYHTIYESYTHYFSPSKRLGRKAAAAFSRRVAAQTDALIAPTEKVRALLQSYGLTKPIYLLPTGIDQERFSSAACTSRAALRRELHILPAQTVLIFVGRMAQEKNCDELLRMMLPLRSENLCLLLVGGGPCLKQLQRQAKALGLERQVIFTGMVSPALIDRYYQAGDLFVSASTSEAQGLTYIEALASGLPMLCRRDSCLRGVLAENVNGWLYDTEADFVQKVRRFMDYPKYSAMFSQNARTLSENFSIPVFAQHAERIYQEQIGSRRTALQGATV